MLRCETATEEPRLAELVVVLVEPAADDRVAFAGAMLNPVSFESMRVYADGLLSGRRASEEFEERREAPFGSVSFLSLPRRRQHQVTRKHQK